MSIHDNLTQLFMRRALRSVPARAFILSSIADSEDNGEARIFDDALSAVDDPKLAKMIERHRDDEIRHGKLFRECIERTGFDPGPLPDDVKVLDRLNRHLGGFFDREITDTSGVMEAYLILQVVEERALQQFTVIEPIMRTIDPKTADVFVEVTADEERHLKYCTAISRRYAPDEMVRQSRLQQIRDIEAKVFLENNLVFTGYVVSRGWMPGIFDRVFWPTMNRLAGVMGALPYTEHSRGGSDSHHTPATTTAEFSA